MRSAPGRATTMTAANGTQLHAMARSSAGPRSQWHVPSTPRAYFGPGCAVGSHAARTR